MEDGIELPIQKIKEREDWKDTFDDLKLLLPYIVQNFNESKFLKKLLKYG